MFSKGFNKEFEPAILTSFKKGYSKKQFLGDLNAGIIVGIIAIPLSIALAIASGVSPDKGLLTAVIGGLIIGLLGGSKVQIAGPTGAFVVIVYGIIDKHGIEGLVAATVMAGIILILMGIFKMGDMIKFIPYPITTGFTSGIAVTIFSTQIKDFLGLKMGVVPTEFFEKWDEYIKAVINMQINYSAAIIGILSVVIIMIWPKFSKKIPGSLIAVILMTVIVYYFKIDVETIGSKFGDLKFQMPSVAFSFATLNIREFFSPALTIALLAAIESLLSAVVADGMTGKVHKSNMELIGQGAGNVVSGIFGGIPITGAIARTAANVKNGGSSPIASIIHSVFLLLSMLIFLPYVKLIPMSVLGAILVVVSYNMGEWHELRKITKAPKSDITVYMVTFILTIVLDLVVAIEIGMVLASFLFLKRMADISAVKMVEVEEKKEELYTEEAEKRIFEKHGINRKEAEKIMESIAIYEIDGPFFFGAADKFMKVTKEIHSELKILIINMEKVPVMDATGYHAIEILYDMCKKSKVELFFIQTRRQPLKIMIRYGFMENSMREHFYRSFEHAFERAVEITLKK